MNGVGLLVIIVAASALGTAIAWWFQRPQPEPPYRRGLDALGHAVDTLREATAMTTTVEPRELLDRPDADPSEPGKPGETHE